MPLKNLLANIARMNYFRALT